MNLVLLFQVKPPSLPADVSLKVTGSIAHLGEWNALNAVTMTSGSGLFLTAGLLVNSSELVGSSQIKDGVIEYKYVLVKSTPAIKG